MRNILDYVYAAFGAVCILAVIAVTAYAVRRLMEEDKD